MKWVLTVFIALLVATLALGAHASPPSVSRIRVLLVGKDEVVRVRTAIGYSTILKFDSKPRPVVAGDQDGFKIESSKKFISIKPLVAGAKTNLFVFTDYDRYVFDVVSARGGSADYEIEVRRKAEPRPAVLGAPKSAVETRPLGLSASCGPLTLNLGSVEWSASGEALSLKGDVQAGRAAWVDDEFLQVLPDDFFLYQGKKNLPIESLYLEAPRLTRQMPRVAIALVARRENLREGKPLLMELRGATLLGSCKSIRINLPWSKIRPLRP